ncbi:trehalose operon repressor [Haemophilus paracuniculus]|uniref:Trehalose operon repressor n=1 Tax=Haemophilus paracuniculus TaxID=734 RepID=A0A1T0ATW3_9PAST|nr:LacI family DNA-binding transcriptional regulator [Haemophilus paracuniculus]OOR99562.1 trehalose operon repressor [Haemophilus paracuniculus]
MKLTIKDIAERCQVGKSTVSRVLNNDPKVSPATREKVQAMIAELGFQPNRSARAMRGSVEPVVGVIVTRLNSTAESQTLSAILSELYSHQITPLIVESQFQPETVQHQLELFRQRQINGVILFGFSQLPLNIIQQWQGHLVLVARQYPDLSCVYYDDHNAITALLDRLYQQGHRQIGYLGVQDQDETTGRQRTESYLQFCQRHALTPNYVQGDLSFESGYQLCPLLLEKPTSAIVCASSSLAVGALKYLQKNQKILPLACIGQNSLLQSFAPDLLTLDFGYPQAGRWAVELLLQQFAGNSATEQRKVPFELT